MFVFMSTLEEFDQDGKSNNQQVYNFSVLLKILALEEELLFKCNTFETKCLALIQAIPERSLQMNVKEYSKSLGMIIIGNGAYSKL